MKIILMLCMLAGVCCEAQTYDEWFKQKKTKKKYLLEQIAALQAYAGVAVKGYGIVSEGSKAIRNGKFADFLLHSDHIHSLWKVNPELTKSADVAEILRMYTDIKKKMGSLLLHTGRSALMSNSEKGYVKNVSVAMASGTDDLMKELLVVLIDNETQMNDAERMQRVGVIHAAMQDRQLFVNAFNRSANNLINQRSGEQKEIQHIKKTHGL